MTDPRNKRQNGSEIMNSYHPNVQQIASAHRFRPFRRIRNLLDHLDTAYCALDDIAQEREAAVKALFDLADPQLVGGHHGMAKAALMRVDPDAR